MIRKAVMIIGAAEEHCIGIKTAHKMGLLVFATDGNQDSPGFVIADDYAIASTYDHEATLNVARNFIAGGGRIDGVITLASDVPYTVAYVAENLGLPTIGTEAALNTSEKMRMKERLQDAAVPLPLFEEVLDEAEALDVAEAFGLPLVVKPIDSRGARGVQLIKNRAELLAAFTVARRYSPAGRIMVEQYLPGPQLSVEGLMLEGEAYVPAIFDRNYEFLMRFSPFIVENGGEMPSIYSKQYWDEVHAVMKRAALALGIRTGIIKGDLVIHEGQVKIIELAARLSGGFFGTVATPVSCGIDLLRLNIDLCLGNRIDPKELDHKLEKAVAIRFAFPKQGRLKSVTGFDEVLRHSACRFAHIFAKKGDALLSITNHPGRPAVVVAEGSSLDEAINHAEQMIGMLHWEIESA